MAEADRQLIELLFGYRKQADAARVIGKSRQALNNGINRDKIYFIKQDVVLMLQEKGLHDNEEVIALLSEHWPELSEPENLKKWRDYFRQQAAQEEHGVHALDPMSTLRSNPKTIMITFPSVHDFRTNKRNLFERLQDFLETYEGNVLLFVSNDKDALEVDSRFNSGAAQGFSVYQLPENCLCLPYIAFQDFRKDWKLMLPIKSPDYYAILDEEQALRITGFYLDQVDPHIPDRKGVLWQAEETRLLVHKQTAG